MFPSTKSHLYAQIRILLEKLCDFKKKMTSFRATGQKLCNYCVLAKDMLLMCVPVVRQPKDKYWKSGKFWGKVLIFGFLVLKNPAEWQHKQWRYVGGEENFLSCLLVLHLKSAQNRPKWARNVVYSQQPCRYTILWYKNGLFWASWMLQTGLISEWR